MTKIFYRCKKCLFPNTKPDLFFDKDGICQACKYVDYYRKIDWNGRREKFDKLIESIKKQQGKSNYDCIISVSGGKDSTYQTYLITKIAKLKPLLVCFEPSHPTEVGKKNLDNLVKTFNCDLIYLKKSPVYKKLSKIGLEIVGDHEWPNHVGIYCWPVQVANNFNIKINFYGEERGLIGLGRPESFYGEGVEIINRDYIEQYVGMNGYRLTDIMQYDKTIKEKDVLPYIYPTNIKSNIKSYCLGHFFQWDYNSNLEIIKKFGWQSRDKPTEGTFTNFEDIDCGFMPYHQYFKFIKYGYGRATDHVGHEIRNNRMKREQGKQLILEYDGKLPREYFKEFLEFLNITEDQFYNYVDKFANPKLFKNDGEKFYRSNDHNLIPTQQYYDSLKDS